MATMRTCKPAPVLGLLVAALVIAAAQAAAVTIYNPTKMVVNIEDDTGNKRVEMTTAMMTMEIPQEQQDMQISQAGAEVVDVSVRDFDVVVLIPDSADGAGTGILAFKVVAMAGTPILPEPADMAAAGEPIAAAAGEPIAAAAGEPIAAAAGEPIAAAAGEPIAAAAGEPIAASSVDTANDIPSDWDRAYTNRKMATGLSAAIQVPKPSTASIPAYDTASIPAYDTASIPAYDTASNPSDDQAYNARLLDLVKPPGFD